MRFLLGVVVGAAITLTASEQFPELKALATQYLERASDTPTASASTEPLPAHDRLPIWASDVEPVEATDPGEPPATSDIPEPPPEPQRATEMPADDSLVASLAEDLTAPATGVDTAANPQRATIWTPFHSENSAKGFAGMLTRELGREFQVDRESAGRYQVTFAYNDDAERGSISEQVMAITCWARVGP
jgi:hypothetical protein